MGKRTHTKRSLRPPRSTTYSAHHERREMTTETTDAQTAVHDGESGRHGVPREHPSHCARQPRRLQAPATGPVGSVGWQSHDASEEIPASRAEESATTSEMHGAGSGKAEANAGRLHQRATSRTRSRDGAEIRHVADYRFGQTRRFYKRIATWTRDQSVTSIDSTMPRGAENSVADRMAHEWHHVIEQEHSPMDS